MRKLCIYILFICLASPALAQDLNARVSVLAPKLQNVNKRVFDDLANAMKDFLNGRKWCADPIAPQERFECSFVFNATSYDNAGNWSGELQVQSSRPVFNTSYMTTLLSVNDRDISFSYSQGETLDYSDQSFTSNLTSVLAFYAYIIVGMDYDSFSRYGGSSYFAEAQNVANLAQSSSYKGWKAFDNNNVSRYWLSENLNNKYYAPLRSFMYDYHRQGLDVMADNSGKGLKEIVTILPVLAQIDRTRLGSMFPLVFFTAKSDELAAILSKADGHDKIEAMNLLLAADPGDGNKYQALQGKQ